MLFDDLLLFLQLHLFALVLKPIEVQGVEVTLKLWDLCVSDTKFLIFVHETYLSILFKYLRGGALVIRGFNINVLDTLWIYDFAYDLWKNPEVFSFNSILTITTLNSPELVQKLIFLAANITGFVFWNETHVSHKYTILLPIEIHNISLFIFVKSHLSQVVLWTELLFFWPLFVRLVVSIIDFISQLIVFTIELLNQELITHFKSNFVFLQLLLSKLLLFSFFLSLKSLFSFLEKGFGVFVDLWFRSSSYRFILWRHVFAYWSVVSESLIPFIYFLAL